jgi:hypothetical protein
MMCRCSKKHSRLIGIFFKELNDSWEEAFMYHTRHDMQQGASMDGMGGVIPKADVTSNDLIFSEVTARFADVQVTDDMTDTVTPKVKNDVIPSAVRPPEDMVLTGMLMDTVYSGGDVFAADILRPVGRADIYKLARQMGSNPPPAKVRKNNWDIDVFESPSKKDIDSFIPKCVDLGVHEAFNAYGDAVMKNGEKFRAALKGGILYLLPYAPFVNASTPRDAMMGSLPTGLYEVSFYYLKPFVSKQVCPAIASLGGNQDLLYPRIWRDLVFEYEFIHWGVLETVCGRCYYYKWLYIRSDEEYQFKISKTLWPSLVLINNEVRGDSTKLKEHHWGRIVKNFGESWHSIFKLF